MRHSRRYDFQGHPRSGSRSRDDLSPLSGLFFFNHGIKSSLRMRETLAQVPLRCIEISRRVLRCRKVPRRRPSTTVPVRRPVSRGVHLSTKKLSGALLQISDGPRVASHARVLSVHGRQFARRDAEKSPELIATTITVLNAPDDFPVFSRE